jgi:murein DD-endopeptidase MepM/ murein hydrolase activator NlpD
MRRFCLLSLILLVGCSVPRWPVDGPLISPFGLRREGIGFGIHHGVDIRVPTGTAVRAMAPGRVTFAGSMRGYGWVVMIEHGGDVVTVYAHLSEVQAREGQAVQARDVIGLSGASGNASTPHLHFEIIRGGTAEDPVVLLGAFPHTR